MQEPTFDTDLSPLLDLIARLRGPDGCPWDREQTLADLRAYLLEEAHETAAALDRVVGGGEPGQLAEELGDLLFQVCFVLELAREAGDFSAADVIAGIHRKMVDRHPHVFGSRLEAALDDADQVRNAWEVRKARERRATADGADGSVLDGVPASLPALLAAYRMTQKAAGVGFDWPTVRGVLDKLDEELEELGQELSAETTDEDAVTEELGDVLFTVANLSRKLGRDPEAVLAAANAKFRRRFSAVERRLAQKGRPIEEASLEEMEELWRQGKG